jgi:hypothetical protein
VSEKMVAVAWVVYILIPIISIFTGGVLTYHYLPDQQYDPSKHELLESHEVVNEEDGPRAGEVYEAPDKWRNIYTGNVFTADQFAAHSRSEARRLGVALFAYGLIGCTLHGYIRYRRYAANFFESFGKAVIVNIIVAGLVYWLTLHLR